MKTRIATLFTLIILFIMFAVSMPVHAHYHTDTGWKTTNEPERAIYILDRIRVPYEPDSIVLRLDVSLVVYCEGMVTIETGGIDYRIGFPILIQYDDNRTLASMEFSPLDYSDNELRIRDYEELKNNLKEHDVLRIVLPVNPFLDKNHIMARFDISGYEQAYRNHCWR